jgi:hypothetical protein
MYSPYDSLNLYFYEYVDGFITPSTMPNLIVNREIGYIYIGPECPKTIIFLTMLSLL